MPYLLTDRQTDRQKDRQKDRQTTYIQMYQHRHTGKLINKPQDMQQQMVLCSYESALHENDKKQTNVEYEEQKKHLELYFVLQITVTI